jgi:hypothetical protein
MMNELMKAYLEIVNQRFNVESLHIRVARWHINFRGSCTKVMVDVAIFEAVWSIL